MVSTYDPAKAQQLALRLWAAYRKFGGGQDEQVLLWDKFCRWAERRLGTQFVLTSFRPAGMLGTCNEATISVEITKE